MTYLFGVFVLFFTPGNIFKEGQNNKDSHDIEEDKEGRRHRVDVHGNGPQLESFLGERDKNQLEAFLNG